MTNDEILFLDMDGVIVDLHKVVYEKFKVTCEQDQTKWNNGELGIPDAELWADTDPEWWANLPWTENGRDILNVCERFFSPENIVICSKPANWSGSAEGKLLWLKRHLPQYAYQYIMTPTKWWAASNGRYLIDDSERNIDKFLTAGGNGFLVPRPWNRLRDEQADTLTDLHQNIYNYMTIYPYDQSEHSENDE